MQHVHTPYTFTHRQTCIHSSIRTHNYMNKHKHTHKRNTVIKEILSSFQSISELCKTFFRNCLFLDTILCTAEILSYL